MTTFLSFQICSLFYIILLLVIYFTKKRFSNIDNKIYPWLIITNFVGVIFDILSTYMAHSDYSNILLNPISKFYLVYLASWLMLLTIYIVCISNINIKFTKEQLWVKILVIFHIILVISLLVSPLHNYSSEEIIYTYGPGTIIVYSFALICIITWITCLIFNRKDIISKKYIPFFTFIILGSIAGLIQFIFPQILLVTFVLVFTTFLMYFTIENPDLEMINILNMAKDQAEKANNAKSDFLSSMSHEIRTPLNAIVGFSECIKEADNLDEAKENATDVISASGTLLEIVNGILDISKIEAGKLEIINSDYDTADLFSTVERLIIARLGDKPLDFKTFIAQDIPPVLYGDHSNIKKVIINLLTNAVKYTDTGFVEFRVNCINTKDICRLVISVEDSGRGIQKENIDKLFTKFQRLDEDRNTTIEGTGLGLAITRQLVELMGGKIVVQSIYGQGSKFTVAIDQRIELKPLEENCEVIVEDVKFDLADKRILIVDDNKLNLKIAKKILSAFNPIIDLAESGISCIDMIKNGNKYDLILMDDMMPHMSGIETLKKLKDVNGFNTPTIALTANAISGIKEKYIKEGFDDYLSKPIDRKELSRVVRKHIKNINYSDSMTLVIDSTSKPVEVNIPIVNSVQEDKKEQLDLTGKRILIVDDNSLNIKIATKFLKPYNPIVDSVPGGQECIDKINNHEEFDLIFMDDMMPKINGVETFKTIKATEGFIIPVVALTANAVEGSREKYLADGFDDYLSKPIIKVEFDRVLRTHIK